MITGSASQPEIVADLELIGREGETKSLGHLVAIVEVNARIDNKSDGMVTLDIPEFEKRGQNLIIRVSLQQLQVALASAAINAK